MGPKIRISFCDYGIMCLSWLIVVIIELLILPMSGGYRNEPLNRVGCVWSNSVSGSNSVSVTTINSTATLDCNVRTLNPEFWNFSFTREQRIKARGVRIKCSDKLLFESFLSRNPRPSFFVELENMEYLSIESCKIRKIQNPGVWSPSLRSLKISTYNADWLSTIGLEIEPGGFEGLNRLENLDLSVNNVWVFSELVLCPLRALRTLNMSHNHLSEVSISVGRDCSGGKNLELMDLSFNTIRKIGINSFPRLEKLAQLLLHNNYIEELEDSALSGLRSLKTLDLSANRLVALPPRLFQDTKYLGVIFLQNNSISALSQSVFWGLESLRVLDLSRNTLTSQWIKENIFKGLRSLNALRLSFNQLSYLDPLIFGDLINLQSLSLDNNRIENISPEAFSSLTNLQTLDLSRNRMSVIDSRVLTSFCFVLRQLYLDHNRIRRIEEDGLRNCTNLQDLGMAGNILPEVPAALRSTNLGLLRTLDLGENRIVGVSNESFLGLGQLYGLRLVDNRISDLPAGFCDSLARLRVLNLAQNRINSISEGAFAGCPELRALRLDTNALEEIPPSLSPQLPALLWLNVSENRIRRADVSTLPYTLEWLDLSYNSIETLGGTKNRAPAQKSNLRVLDASHNRLTRLDSASIQPSLETLRLNHNQIQSLGPDTFVRANRLRRIELASNQLENLPLSSLRLAAPLPLSVALPQIYLSGNPFLCDCSMEWFTRVNEVNTLRQYPRIMDMEGIQCHGKSDDLISTIQDSEFLCDYKSHCFPLCHCCDFDACDCEMTCPESCSCSHDISWAVNIVECSNSNLSSIPSRLPMDATRIHLDGNRLSPSVPSHLFIGKRNLRVLALNGSQIEFLRNKTFNGLKALETLRLEDNSLTELHGWEFTDLDNLRELYLHNNQLTHISNLNVFQHLKYLQILTLHGNLLSQFSPWTALSYNGYLTSVTLAGNTFTCECDFVKPFQTWVNGRVSDSQLVTCQFQNEELAPNSDYNTGLSNTPIMSACNPQGTPTEENNQISSSRNSGAFASAVANTNINDDKGTPGMDSNTLMNNSPVSRENQNGVLWASVSAGVILALGLIVFIILAIFRRQIQFRWQKQNMCLCLTSPWICCSAGGKKQRTNHNSGVSRDCPPSDCDDNDKLFDAYFLYSRRDEDLMAQKMAPELERDSNSGCAAAQAPPLRLCLHYRDLYLTPTSENPWNPDLVLSACDSSRRVVLVLSRAFLQTEWTREEFRRALSAMLRVSSKKLIVVLLPPLSPTSLLNSAYAYPELRLTLSTASVLSWTEDNFWAKFRLLLPTPPATATAPPYSISQSCHYCGTLPTAAHIAGHHQNNHHDRPYTNLHFGNSNSKQQQGQGHWSAPGLTFNHPGFVTLVPSLPPVQFTPGHAHPNYHRQENSLSTISNTYLPLTEQNFSDSTNTIGSSSNEELDHIYSTLDTPIQSPGSGHLGSPKMVSHRNTGGSGSSSSGIGSGTLTSPSELGSGPPLLNNGQMYFV